MKRPKSKAWRRRRYAQHRAWAERNPESYRRAKFAQRLKEYGLTVEQYEAMEKAQGGVCAICRQAETHQREGCYRLSVDHCHATGRVRGLLCNRCNRAIGLLGDTPDLVARAVEYLRCS